MTDETLSDDDVLALYRLAHPRARRTRSTAIVHSGTARLLYDCVCGSLMSRATRWPETKRVKTWRIAHEGCLRLLVLRLDRPVDWRARVAARRVAARRVAREQADYGQDEADGAACRAMAVALAATVGERQTRS